jgi:hypothetical protein
MEISMFIDLNKNSGKDYLLERILEEPGLNTFFSSYKGFTKLEYDVYGFAKLLIFGRLLRPASKCATVRRNDDYYEPILGEHNPDNVTTP